MGKLNFYHKFFLFLLLLLVGNSLAQSSQLSLQQGHKPIEWQKIDLQERVEQKVKDSLFPILKTNEYVVQVRIELDDSKKIDLSTKSAPPPGGNKDKGGKGDEDDKKKKKGVKFSSDITDEPSEDYIVFSKLGLEAPIYGVEEEKESLVKIDFGAARKGGKPGASPKTSEVDLIQKTLVELNDKYNLFKYLLGVDIVIFLDEALLPESREAIEKIVKSIYFNLGDVIPSLKVEYVPLTAKKKQEEVKKEEKEKIEEILGWVSKFSTTIGLVLATFLLGVFGWILLSKYEKLKKIQTLNLKGEAGAGEGAGGGAGAGAGADEAGAGGEGEKGDGEGEGGDDGDGKYSDKVGGLNGVDRFRKYLENSPKEAIILIKKWLKDGSEDSQNALRAIVKLLSNDELMVVFETLKLSDRTRWKEIAATGINDKDLKAAVAYISRQIVEGILVPDVIDDEQVVDLILELSPAEAAKFCDENVEFGALLLNLLNSSVINQIFSNLSNDVVNELIEKSAEFRKEDFEGRIEELKETLSQYQNEVYRAPFLDRVMDLIKLSGGSNERPLFSALAKVEPYDSLVEVARSYLPSDLLPTMSTESFRMAVDQFSLKQLAELFSSMEDTERTNYLDKYAEEGTKAREMIELEVEQIFEDDLAVQRLRKARTEMWNNFLASVRENVRTNPELYKSLKEDIESWVKKIVAEVHGGDDATGVHDQDMVA
ncbi:MAG: hypothetical protein ACPGJV_14070 [Bacteriovoracaceae bacterium]